MSRRPITGARGWRRSRASITSGWWRNDPAALAEFYRDVLGMTITGGSGADGPFGATAFLSSRPEEEDHELAIFANPMYRHLAFKVGLARRPARAPSPDHRARDPDQAGHEPRLFARLLLRRSRREHDRGLLAHRSAQPPTARRPARPGPRRTQTSSQEVADIAAACRTGAATRPCGDGYHALNHA